MRNRKLFFVQHHISWLCTMYCFDNQSLKRVCIRKRHRSSYYIAISGAMRIGILGRDLFLHYHQVSCAWPTCSSPNLPQNHEGLESPNKKKCLYIKGEQKSWPIFPEIWQIWWTLKKKILRHTWSNASNLVHLGTCFLLQLCTVIHLCYTYKKNLFEKYTFISQNQGNIYSETGTKMFGPGDSK